MRVITVYHKSDLVPIFDTKSRFIPDSASKKSDATHKGIIRNYTPKKTAYKTSKSISKKDAFIKNYEKKIDYFVDDLAYENASKLKKNTTGEYLNF